MEYITWNYEFNRNSWWMVTYFRSVLVPRSVNTRDAYQKLPAARKWLLLRRSLPCKETPILAWVKKKRHIWSSEARTWHEKEHNHEYSYDYSFGRHSNHFYSVWRNNAAHPSSFTSFSLTDSRLTLVTVTDHVHIVSLGSFNEYQWLLATHFFLLFLNWSKEWSVNLRS